ncbi:head-tail adaptor Ad1 [Burkholderia phage BcepNazgul]|uniref:Head-tail joining protein Lambda W n=1 Tax=Burkholderia phage BcepNazgul TaxID=242861 RepID=Q6UYH8_9CAUD|nr:head-tail adaptor Ad1 [Burkholderia phage BcepNazgul]AAQ63363.1 head-tail joining protein Lambda W [Burkholderia phage BcepNazgul]
MMQPAGSTSRRRRDAYHKLLTGRSARVIVDQNGERVEFTAANQQALVTYIRQLEAQCGDCGPCGGGRSNGPLQFTF